MRYRWIMMGVMGLIALAVIASPDTHQPPSVQTLSPPPPTIPGVKQQVIGSAPVGFTARMPRYTAEFGDSQPVWRAEKDLISIQGSWPIREHRYFSLYNWRDLNGHAAACAELASECFDQEEEYVIFVDVGSFDDGLIEHYCLGLVTKQWRLAIQGFPATYTRCTPPAVIDPISQQNSRGGAMILQVSRGRYTYELVAVNNTRMPFFGRAFLESFKLTHITGFDFFGPVQAITI